MLGNIFYHVTTRKYVAMFGSIFDDIYVRRFGSNGTEIQTIKVPIKYGPIQKWLAILAMHPADKPIAVEVPRLSFEISGWQRDESRKINAVHQIVKITDNNNTLYSQFAPIPYKLTWKLSAMTKNTDDMMQIFEQISPFFNSDFSTTMKLIPQLDYTYDIRINLVNEDIQDVYAGDWKERRTILGEWTFEMDCWYFGPIREQGVIKKVQVDLHSIPGTGPITVQEMETHGRIARIVVTPGLTADGQPTQNPLLTIPYQQIDAEDPYDYIVDERDFADGKRYNPVTGEDQ